MHELGIETCKQNRDNPALIRMVGHSASITSYHFFRLDSACIGYICVLCKMFSNIERSFLLEQVINIGVMLCHMSGTLIHTVH